MSVIRKYLRIADNSQMTGYTEVPESGTANQFNLEGLESDTQYFIDANVVNTRGTARSAQRNFSTLANGVTSFEILHTCCRFAEVQYDYNFTTEVFDKAEIAFTKRNPYTDPTAFDYGRRIEFENGSKYAIVKTIDQQTTYWYRVELHAKSGNIYYSDVLTSTTEEIEPLYIENRSDTSIDITLTQLYEGMEQPIYISSVGGSDYSVYEWWSSGGGVRSATIPKDGRLYIVGARVSQVEELTADRFYSFNSSGDFAIGGDWTTFCDRYCTFIELSASRFRQMFENCTTLVDISDSKIKAAKYIKHNTFYSTFNNCTRLRNGAIATHHKIVGVSEGAGESMKRMFKGCTSLEVGMDLSNYFNGRTADTKANVGTFESMYENCISLVHPPKLPRITEHNGNWYVYRYMFKGCTSLVEAPDMSFTTKLDDHTVQEMFAGCTSLLEGADLRNVTYSRGGEESIYNGCTNLTVAYLPSLSDIDERNYLEDWLYGVAASGTVVGTQDMEDKVKYDDDDGVPVGWTFSTTVPSIKLPAPTYSISNYQMTLTSNYPTDAEAYVYYTTDGSTPTENSTKYTTPFSVSEGDTVKFVAIPTNTAKYIQSEVVTVEIGNITYHDYVHFSELSSKTDNGAYLTPTGITWYDGTYIKVKGKLRGYNCGGLLVGHYGVPDSRTSFSDTKDIRIFNPSQTNRLYYDFVSNRATDIRVGDTDVDLTIGNYYIIDNTTGQYLYNGTPQGISEYYPIFFDLSTWWLSDLKIYNADDELVFDGHAAEILGEIGIYDSVSSTLVANEIYTTVYEDTQVNHPFYVHNISNDE